MIAGGKTMAESAKLRTVLARLRQDASGNVLAITAAAVLPLVGIIGSGVDMSRAYRAKARLQAACDAGALAGRRAMSDLTYTSTARTRADRIFNFNFDPAEYQAARTSFVTSANNLGIVSGVASAQIPTVVMQVFGYEKFELSVNCSADYQVPNIDTMFVLDVTGSMAECPDGSNCNSGPSSKIVGLRAAVRAFYTTLQAAAANNPRIQLRYGFVPYSQAINAQDIFKMNPGAGQLPLTQLVDRWTVPSRVANFTTPIPGGVPTQNGAPTASLETYRKPGAGADTPMSFNDCRDYGNNMFFSIDDGPDSGTSSNPSPSGNRIYRILPGGALTSTRPSTGDYDQLDYARHSPTSASEYPLRNENNTANNYRVCTRSVTTTRFTARPRFGFTSWTYKNIAYDVSQYKAGTGLQYVSAINTSTASVATSGSYDLVQLRQLPDQTGLTSATTVWNGCIEERDTVADATFSPIPSGAHDLNFLTPATNDATRWRSVLPDLAWMRNGPGEETDANNGRNTRPSRICPVASMRNLNVMTLSELDTYLPQLQAAGNTYHDIGMVWGVRMISPSGIFASRNLTGANGGQISRHIIFMTDGILVPNDSAYSTYGIERISRRVAGGSNNPDLTTRHARRFQALCDAARAQGLSVWVIAFGTAITSNLTACADPGRAYAASDSAQLTARFQQIASDIADLRLTQ
jgi:Flp pilus assembly protein TadG